MSWVRATLLSFLALSLTPATPRIFTPCEVASGILQITSTLVRCSPEDVARLVCIASLHNYDTSYSFRINDTVTAVGIFGIPPEFAKNCTNQGKSENIQDSVDCLIASQVERNRDQLTHPFQSEFLCHNSNMYPNDSAIFKVWVNGTLVDHMHARCRHSGLDYLFYTNEALRGSYVPHVMNWGVFGMNEGSSVDKVLKSSCGKMAYCKNDCISRSSKGLLNQQGRRILDQSLIVFSVIAFLAVY